MIVAGLLLLALVLLGAPLFAIIACAALLGFWHNEVDLSAVAIEIYRVAEMPVLIAIPLFTFAGYLLGESQAPRRLVRMTDALLGWMPGGLAVVALLTSALFTAFTGASGVTIVALGTLLYPALRRAGYREPFSLGLVTVSGGLGLLFAPSLPLILYGVVAQQLNVGRHVTINDMFLAGILPGLLMVGLLSIWGLWENRAARLPLTAFSWKRLISAMRESIWELPLPALVLGGIYSGTFAVSEAAAVTAMYVLVIEVFVNREIRLAQLAHIMRESMVMVGGILLILGVSLASTNFLIDAEIPAKLFGFIKAHIDNKYVFLILLNFFLLGVAMMLDIFSALIIMVPLLLPIAIGYGVDPVHLGIIFLANMEIGYFTPPLGLNLFIASIRFNKPVLEIFRSTLPFFFLLLLGVLIITYWPALSLGLLHR